MKDERRQVTILNCDIFGSSAYVDALDEEDLTILLKNFFSGTCNRVIEEYRGTVAQNSGDGVIAYFGYPKTRGQDARDAIDCGKLIVESLAEESLSEVYNLRVRIAITTGMAVLTDIPVQGGKPDLMAYGRPAHRSDRIQRLAEAGEVLVDEASRRLAEQFYEFIDRGTHKLRGFRDTSQIWAAGSPRQLMSRFEERGPALAPVIGRDPELELLSVLWSQAREGKGWAAYINGEPGIGKSRLIFEFARQNAAYVSPIVMQCLVDHENAPLHPWLNYINQLAGVDPADTISARQKKVNGILGESFSEHDWLPSFVLQLLTQGGSKQEPENDEIGAPRRLRALKDAIVEGLLERCSRSPQILIVEDTHWIDPTSKALLETLLESISSARVMVLITSRNEASLEVTGSHTTRLELARLNANQARQLATTILDSGDDHETLVTRLIKRSDGIPLYVEEMARAISEGEPDSNGSRVFSDPEDGDEDSDLAIPGALMGALYTRLDALGDRKWIAQLASVIGRAFDLQVLARLSGRSPDSLGDDIGALLDSGLIESVRTGTKHLFGFKHALVRDAAYNSLLRSDAQKLHGELARLYEREYPEMRQTQPEVVVRHLAKARRWLDAANLWLEAGEFATEVGSTMESMTRLKHCLECLNHLSSSPQVDLVRMRAQLGLGLVINTHYGPANPEAQQALDLAAGLAESLNDTAALVECLTSLAKVKYNAGDFPGAERVASRMIEIGEQFELVDARVKGLTNSGLCKFAMGEFNRARVELEQALQLIEQADSETRLFECLVLNYLALTVHIMGNPKLAKELCDNAQRKARTQRTNYRLSTLGNSLYLYWIQNNKEATRETALELSRVAERSGHLMWYYQAAFFLGWVSAVEGDETGLEKMESSMTRFRDAGELVEQSLFFAIMAERHLAFEHYDLALSAVNQGLELAERLSERFFEVPLLQMKARCLDANSEAVDSTLIAEILERASQLAREQGASAWLNADSNRSASSPGSSVDVQETC